MICLNKNNQTKKQMTSEFRVAFSEYPHQPPHFEDFWTILVLTQELKSLDPVVVMYFI